MKLMSLLMDTGAGVGDRLIDTPGFMNAETYTNG